MMNDEMNTHDEFEDWLKQSADKHRMYPSDKLWRNINEQLHEQPNWPALTFGAILTMALITATLIFLHPTKNVFTIPNYAYNYTSQSPEIKNTVIPVGTTSFQSVKSSKQKDPVYAFNSQMVRSHIDSVVSPAAFSQSTEEIATLTNAYQTFGTDVTATHPSLQKVANPVLHSSTLTADVATATVDSFSTTEATKSAAEKSLTDQLAEKKSEDLLTDKSIAKTIHLPKPGNKNWYIELYGGSNISYRRLSESVLDNHTALSQPLAAERGNLNNLVSQKPSVGINVGAAFVYAISNRFRVKAGVQLNFRQYNIDAYKSSFERSVLLLNNGFYYPDSVYTYSAISNAQGKAISLSNKYYQVGIPVGLEWTAVKLHNLHFNLAANVQPTYQINSNNYLLTSDYKSYVQAPSLLRRININAGVEATANFNAGNLQWQVGPQVLYQTMPTQKANYSIHEHLIDYGIRVGIIKKL